MTTETLSALDRPTAKRIIRLPEICRRTGLSRASIYDEIARGNFPKLVKLGMRTVGGVESEVDAWIEARIAARDEAA
jgi:prophage regulatory protein